MRNYILDMDNSNPSSLPDRRIHKREIRPLACRRILRLHSWHPTLEAKRGDSNLLHRLFAGKTRLLHPRTRRHARIQLQDARLGRRDPESHRRQGSRHHHRLHRRLILRIEPQSRGQRWTRRDSRKHERLEITRGRRH